MAWINLSLSQNLFEKDESAAEVEEALEERGGLLVADAESAEVLEPRDRAFDGPATCVLEVRDRTDEAGWHVAKGCHVLMQRAATGQDLDGPERLAGAASEQNRQDTGRVSPNTSRSGRRPRCRCCVLYKYSVRVFPPGFQG